MYKYLFGPIPSRRLGLSLGVDLVPKKVCSLDCVYCEVGATTKLTLQRKEYIRAEEIIAELQLYFDTSPDPDTFTFSGYGEPTLNLELEKVLKFIKSNRPASQIAMITNATLFEDESLVHSLRYADIVLPSLDAATDSVFKRINRPHSDLEIEKCIESLVSFRETFTGQMHLEIMILPGYNDSDSELMALKEAINRIKPDIVQLNTLDRPGVLKNLRAATFEELEAIITLWDLPNVSIISKVAKAATKINFRTDMRSAIMQTIDRRPCTIDDLVQMIGEGKEQITACLDVMMKEGEVEMESEKRGIFYQNKKRLVED